MFLIDVEIIRWLLILAASGTAFMIGKSWNRITTDRTIEMTIMFLVENNLVKFKRDKNGEIEILPLDE